MNTLIQALRPAAAVLAGLSLMLATNGFAVASPSFDEADVQFIDGWSAAGDKAIVIHTSGRDYRAEINGPLTLSGGASSRTGPRFHRSRSVGGTWL